MNDTNKNQGQFLWSLAGVQTKQIGRIKDSRAKNRQVVLLCKTWLLALKQGGTP